MYEFVFTSGGSAKGDTPRSTGECTEVASANRGVRGGLSDEFDEELDVRSLVKGSGFFLLKFAGGNGQHAL